MKKRTLLLLLIFPGICFLYTLFFVYSHKGPADLRRVNALELNAKGQHELMIEKYEPLLKKYPDEIEIYYTLAWAYYKTGDFASSKKLIDHYTEHNPFYEPWKSEYIHKMKYPHLT